MMFSLVVEKTIFTLEGCDRSDAFDRLRQEYCRSLLCCFGLLATGDYVTDQRLGTDYWILLSSTPARFDIGIVA